MKTKNKYYFPFVASISDFQKARIQISKIYLESGALIRPFDVDTEDTIDWLTSICRYAKFVDLEEIINIVLLRNIDYRTLIDSLLNADCCIAIMSSRIELIRNQFKCLKYYNDESEIPAIVIDYKFKQNVDSFLVQIRVWKPFNQYDELALYQREWDNQYHFICHHLLYCSCIEEITDTYKYTFLFWINIDKLGNEILPEVNKIWDNREMFRRMLE